jgi:hypothetical protein
MATDLILPTITVIYAACSAARLLMYVPQLLAVKRDRCGAHAISLITWTSWALSHAVAAIYCYAVASDALLAGMMLGNTAGSTAVAALTLIKRRKYAADQAVSGASCEFSAEMRRINRFRLTPPYVLMKSIQQSTMTRS